jgi:hypothetical protein
MFFLFPETHPWKYYCSPNLRKETSKASRIRSFVSPLDLCLKPAHPPGTLFWQRAASFVDGSTRSLVKLLREPFHPMKVLNVLAHLAKRLFLRRGAHPIVTIDSDIPAI